MGIFCYRRRRPPRPRGSSCGSRPIFRRYASFDFFWIEVTVAFFCTFLLFFGCTNFTFLACKILPDIFHSFLTRRIMPSKDSFLRRFTSFDIYSPPGEIKIMLQIIAYIAIFVKYSISSLPIPSQSRLISFDRRFLGYQIPCFLESWCHPSLLFVQG